MRSIVKAVSIFLFFSVLLTSCMPVTPVPTSTVTPSITVLPTHTSIPEPSVTATPNIVNAMFPIPTYHVMPDGALTPRTTPVPESSSMKLKELSEKDLLDFIQEINKQSYEYYPPLIDWWTISRFIESQKPVALAIQEFLYRYPSSSVADELRWRLAFINSIVPGGLGGNQYGDEWMLRELEKSLEYQEVKPDQLENILKFHSFDVVYIKPIDNLFMDQQTAWLYQIVPQLWRDDEFTKNETFSIGSLFFVVRMIGENEFKLYLLKSAWALYSGESYVFDVSDHNGNGYQEIALYIGYHSGTTCSGKLLIYEWELEQFTELTHDGIKLRECTEDFTYSLLQDVPSIIYSAVIPKRTIIYSWNGQYYEWDRTVDIDPFDLWNYSYDKSEFSYDEEIEILRNAIESDKARKFGSAYPDYLRFRIGITYALDAKREDAIKELQDIISSPVDPTRKIFPDMAREFLRSYKGNEDVYRACRKSAQVYENALEPYRDSNGNVDDQSFQDVMGFSQDSFYFAELPLCNVRDAFAMLVDSISSAVTDIPFELRKYGVELSYVQKIDINLDGKSDEWIVVFGSDISFLIFPDGSRYHASALAESIAYRGERNSSVNIDVETWNGFQSPVLVIQTARQFFALEIDKNYTLHSLFDEYGVTTHVISNQDISSQVQLFYIKPKPESYYPYMPWGGYRWDIPKNEFRNDLFEFYIFVLHDAQTAAQLADTIQPLLEDWKDVSDNRTWILPYLYYLDGLSYELSGNQEKAVQVYWQLWHDYPESHFALLVRYKLELVSQ